MTYQESNQRGRVLLEEQCIEDATVDAWLLLEFVTGMNRTRFFVDGNKEMPKAEEEQYFALIEQRKKRIPLQHLTGVQEFMGLEFQVNEHVLIPRQDTELLVLEAEKQLKSMEADQRQVLDMCTGSGCIAISLKKRNPEIICHGADISEKALETARSNAQILDTEIDFIQTDMFTNIEGRFDIIVSNPPYIPSKVIETLMPEVRDHEPIKALDGKEDGLYFYRRITEESVAYLKPGGYLLYEIGHDQGEAVSSYMRENGFDEIEVIRDLAGLDRVVRGRR